MTHDDFKKRLLEERAQIAQALEGGMNAAETVELDQTTQGRLSRMDAMQQQQMAMAAQRRRHDRLRAVDAALKRIEDGDFGYCLNCGEDIAPARLKLDPAVALCIDCA